MPDPVPLVVAQRVVAADRALEEQPEVAIRFGIWSMVAFASAPLRR